MKYCYNSPLLSQVTTPVFPGLSRLFQVSDSAAPSLLGSISVLILGWFPCNFSLIGCGSLEFSLHSCLTVLSSDLEHIDLDPVVFHITAPSADVPSCLFDFDLIALVLVGQNLSGIRPKH